MQYKRHKARNKARNATHKIYKGKKQGKRCIKYKTRDKIRDAMHKTYKSKK